MQPSIDLPFRPAPRELAQRRAAEYLRHARARLLCRLALAGYPTVSEDYLARRRSLAWMTIESRAHVGTGASLEMAYRTPAWVRAMVFASVVWLGAMTALGVRR